MSDDAEFDAFLNGEGELARGLREMAQPGPSAALDAAILANARAAMAQDARPRAANDSGADSPAPQLARSLGWRWRVPAGIAASVLVGVFAKQAFEASGDLNQTSVPAPAAEMVFVPSVDVKPPPPPAMEVATDNVTARAPAPAVEARSAPAPVQANPAPEPAVYASKTRASATVAAPVPAPVVGLARPAMPAKPSPSPQILNDSNLKPLGGVEAATSSGYVPSPIQAKRNYLESEVDVRAALPPPPSAAPVIEMVPAPAPAPKVLGRKQAFDYSRSAPAERAANTAEAPATPVAARDWLDRIEKLLAQGRKSEAVTDWKAFRAAYPEYPVPDTTKSQLE